MTASNKVNDTVKALNGVGAGAAVTPVAAVNVTGAGVEAYMGNVSDDSLNVKDSINVSAKTNARHEMKADASASGSGAAIGA